MSRAFDGRMTRSPRAQDRDRGSEAALLFPDLPGQCRDLIAGAAGSSPYLHDLLRSERDWIADALSDPEEAARQVLTDLDPEARTLSSDLRQAKRRTALLAALCDLGGVWTLEQVTGTLTALADRAVDVALAFHMRTERNRGRLPEDASPPVAFAMGKMGAHELNYSSDIDLIVLFDDASVAASDLADHRAALIRVTRNVVTMLSDTRGGYVFRTDLRLRPDAATTPVCLSMDAAERYYESVGRTWERAAWIKARPAAGDIASGESFLARLAPFVWRRHLDFWAIRDAEDMRRKIRAQKGLHPDGGLDGMNIKLSPGGIREIEFFAQTRQIILGGRDASLRVRGTVEALRRLDAKGWAENAEVLIDDYRAFREIEHRLQMIADRQTHDLPQDEAGWERIAALCGREVGDLRQDLARRVARVSRITDGFFTPAPKRPMRALGDTAEAIVQRWPGYPAMRSERAAEIFERVGPELLSRLDRAARPDEALAHLDAFLAGLPAGVQVFSLFDANPQLVDLIVDIAATSPDLSLYLSRHPGVLEAVLDGAFFADWPGEDALAENLETVLATQSDYESRLIAARRWHNDWRFRIGVHLLRGLVDAATAGGQYADLARSILRVTWPVVCKDFARRHGIAPGRGAAVVGLGSLGAGMMTPTSDLDLLVIYDADGAETSTGKRPLDARTYFARLTQAFITAITANLGPGRLYEVDMRLRPSGRQGPVATSLDAFRHYQRNEAWTWEHLAMTRAATVAGSADVRASVEAFRTELVGLDRDGDAIRSDGGAMRARLLRDKPGNGPWDMAGGGGRLTEITLVAQAGALIAGSARRDVPGQIAQGADALGLDRQEADILTRTWRLLWAVRTMGRLVAGEGLDPDAIGEGGRGVLARAGGAEDTEALKVRIALAVAAAAPIVAQTLPAPDE